jgi:OOP family OmpA-OmpF porin
VPDEADECPNTPAGSKVLANGCALKGDCRTPRPGEQVDESGCAAGQAFILKGVVFEYDSTTLTADAKGILDGVAETLKSYADISVEIAGHTDNTGGDAYNLGLSERRSIAVKDYLTAHGVDAARMTPVGYGEAQPIDSNETEAGRTNNRRVELRVLDGEDGGATAATPAADSAAPAESAPADAGAEPAADAPATDPAADPAAEAAAGAPVQ